MNGLHLTWMTTLATLVLWLVILYKVQRNPDLRARWLRGDRIRFRLRLLMLVLPSVAIIAWIGPRVARGFEPLPALETWASQLESERSNGAGPQQQLEAKVTSRIAAALSGTIGVEPFRVVVSFEPAGNAGMRPLSLDLVVDEFRVDYDSEAETYSVVPRPRKEIDAALETAKTVSEFDAARGDRVSLTTLPFDHAGLIDRYTMHRSESRKLLWTDRARSVARVLGVLGFVLVLMFVVNAMDRGVMQEEEVAAGDSSSEEAT